MCIFFSQVHGRELQQAVELWETLEGRAQEVEDWTERAHKVIKSPLVWDSLDTAEEQVAKHHVSHVTLE